jgi:hypothetical protein
MLSPARSAWTRTTSTKYGADAERPPFGTVVTGVACARRACSAVM